MRDDQRSLCPINLALEVFGDRWTLLIVRDLMFAGKRHFRELLQSEERISSNILADRLRQLVEAGIVTRADDPNHKQKATYSLTEQGIALLPILAQIGSWGRRYLPVTEESSATAAWLEQGGPALWDEIASRLRETHLGAPVTSRS
jgi:DNA-binding HxlR family transcriptional regulator